MGYTYQEKCVAAIECKLWWRFPDNKLEGDRAWSRVTDDIVRPEREDLEMADAEYHIGDEPPTPPRVLSELERELLAVAEHCEQMLLRYGIDAVNGGSIEDEALQLIRAAIAKAKGEA